MRRMAKILGVVALAVLVSAAGAIGGQVYFYHTDPAGTPLAMSDASGNVVWRADYRPFGEIQSESGTAPNDKLFVGKEKDDETGLYYFGARYMDDRIGRFIAPDPIGAVDPKTGKINRMVLLNPQRQNYYAYALNNPYSYIDANGEAAALLLLRQMLIAGRGVIAGDGVAGVTGAITGAFIGGTLGQMVIDALKEDSQGTEEGKKSGQEGKGQNKGESTDAQGITHKGEVTKEVVERKTEGQDGATSRHIVEREDGQAISRTHQVIKDGKIVHQHQDHIGKHGTERRFPDKWTGTKTVD